MVRTADLFGVSYIHFLSCRFQTKGVSRTYLLFSPWARQRMDPQHWPWIEAHHPHRSGRPVGIWSPATPTNGLGYSILKIYPHTSSGPFFLDQTEVKNFGHTAGIFFIFCQDLPSLRKVPDELDVRSQFTFNCNSKLLILVGERHNLYLQFIAINQLETLGQPHPRVHSFHCQCFSRLETRYCWNKVLFLEASGSVVWMFAGILYSFLSSVGPSANLWSVIDRLF
jgi:hypothetical protein